MGRVFLKRAWRLIVLLGRMSLAIGGQFFNQLWDLIQPIWVTLITAVVVLGIKLYNYLQLGMEVPEVPYVTFIIVGVLNFLKIANDIKKGVNENKELGSEITGMFHEQL